MTILSPGRRMVHDLNNLLFVLLGRCDNMRELLPSDHPVHEDIDAITMAAERLQALVGDLQAWDRTDPGTNCTDSSGSTS
jgi:hypothetical protein